MIYNESEHIRLNLIERKKNLEIKYAVSKQKNEELIEINLQLKLIKDKLSESQIKVEELEFILS